VTNFSEVDNGSHFVIDNLPYFGKSASVRYSAAAILKGYYSCHGGLKSCHCSGSAGSKFLSAKEI
jgi:hypothetical protein